MLGSAGNRDEFFIPGTHASPLEERRPRGLAFIDIMSLGKHHCTESSHLTLEACLTCACHTLFDCRYNTLQSIGPNLHPNTLQTCLDISDVDHVGHHRQRYPVCLSSFDSTHEPHRPCKDPTPVQIGGWVGFSMAYVAAAVHVCIQYLQVLLSAFLHIGDYFPAEAHWHHS